MKTKTAFILVFLVTALFSSSFAQHLGIRAGINLSSKVFKVGDERLWEEGTTYNPGFHVGATAEFPITEAIFLETDLLLTTKGFKYSEKETFEGQSYSYKEKMNLFYLEVPITLKALHDLGNMKLYGQLGPYIGMGLFGKLTVEESYNGNESDSFDIEWGSDENSDLKRLDYGLTFGAGTDLGAIHFGLFYNLGLANMSPTDTYDESMKSRVLGFTVGYRIK
jgi:hypothetical protein